MTDRQPLRMRPVEASDARALYDMGRSDPAGTRLGGPLPLTESDARALTECSARKGSGYLLALESADDGALVGFARIDALRYDIGSARFWLYVRADARGRGYGAEALGRLRDALFHEHNLVRMQTSVPADDPAAAWLMARGFQREVVRREALFLRGRYVDDWLLACLR